MTAFFPLNFITVMHNKNLIFITVTMIVFLLKICINEIQ